MRKQNGHIINISGRWYVRYWERRNLGGTVEQKRVSHCLGPVTTRGKRPPGDILKEAAQYMATVNNGAVEPSRIVTIGDFVENVYLPWIQQHNRPGTAANYRIVWRTHLKPVCAGAWLKNTRTFDVQNWLNTIGAHGLSRNSLKHIKSLISGIFKLAKQQGFFDGENPVRDTATNPAAPEPEVTYAYTLDEEQMILAALPEPAATVFAVAAFTGLRIGEIAGLLWENYRDGEINVTRSIWKGRASPPKTRKSGAAVPVIPQLAQRLEMHRLRSGNPQSGPIFRNSLGKPLEMNNLPGRFVLPALNRCEVCGRSETVHQDDGHEYKRDARLPEWHGWHAARRGLGSNLYRLGVPEMVIQRILRHANVSTTATYYIKTATDDVRNAMAQLEKAIPRTLTDTSWTVKPN